MATDRQMVDQLKARLGTMEKAPGFDLESPFYLALKEKVEKLDNVIAK